MYASFSPAEECRICGIHPPAASMARRFLAGPGASWRFWSCEAACNFLRVRGKAGNPHFLEGRQAELLSFLAKALPCREYQMALSLKVFQTLSVSGMKLFSGGGHPGRLQGYKCKSGRPCQQLAQHGYKSDSRKRTHDVTLYPCYMHCARLPPLPACSMETEELRHTGTPPICKSRPSMLPAISSAHLCGAAPI